MPPSQTIQTSAHNTKLQQLLYVDITNRLEMLDEQVIHNQSYRSLSGLIAAIQLSLVLSADLVQLSP